MLGADLFLLHDLLEALYLDPVAHIEISQNPSFWAMRKFVIFVFEAKKSQLFVRQRSKNRLLPNLQLLIPFFSFFEAAESRPLLSFINFKREVLIWALRDILHQTKQFSTVS